MAAVFEVSFNCNKFVSPQILLNYFSKYNWSFSISNISVISDWNWSQEKQIDVTQVPSLIEEYKIISINGLANDCIRAGAMLYKQRSTYQVDLWISTETISFLDASTINSENRRHIEFVTDYMLAVFEKWQINWAAIGCEMFLFESENLMEMMNKSNNVFRWMISPHNAEDINLDQVKEKGKVMILDKYI